MCTLINNGTAPFIKHVSRFSPPGRAVSSGKRPRYGRDDCLRGRRRDCILPHPVNLTASKARAASQRACTPALLVRDIFRWKLEGISAGDIADRLNKDGILLPMEYKKQQGMRFATQFRVNARSVWNATAVLRILKNPVYTGVLKHGGNTTPGYKVKRRVASPREEWSVVKGAHEAAVSAEDFAAVQKALALDTRTSPGSSAVELFSGMASCEECGAAMVRKTVPAGGKSMFIMCAQRIIPQGGLAAQPQI